MAYRTRITSSCPRLSADAPRYTTVELLALLDPPAVKRKGRIVGLVIRHVPGHIGSDLGLSPVLA